MVNLRLQRCDKYPQALSESVNQSPKTYLNHRWIAGHFEANEETSLPESGGVARSAGVVPKRIPAGVWLWNHPSHDLDFVSIMLPS
jgi:hypothetical protein